MTKLHFQQPLLDLLDIEALLQCHKNRNNLVWSKMSWDWMRQWLEGEFLKDFLTSEIFEKVYSIFALEMYIQFFAFREMSLF